MARFGVLAKGESRARRAFTPAEIWQRGRDDVERDAVGALLQGGKEVVHFQVASGPAVAEEERNGIWGWRGLVDVVNIELGEIVDLDSAVVLGKLVQFSFLGTPVESIFPVSREPLNVGEGCAIVPGCAGELVGERCDSELTLELVEFGVRNVDRIGRHGAEQSGAGRLFREVQIPRECNLECQ